MRILTIDRNKWGRGKTSKAALLEDSSKLMCCLGFECLFCGLTEEEILNHGYPRSIISLKQFLSSPQLHHLVSYKFENVENTKFTFAAALLNDDLKLDEVSRETALQELFLTQNIQLEFVN